MSTSDSQGTQNNHEEETRRDLSDSRIGDFLLMRRLGTGGMADVYLAEQTSLDRSVAVKILKEDALAGQGKNSGNAVTQKRFEQEARAAGGLNHPNIVQIFTTGREDNLNYIVQEYVQGLNLGQWIKKHGSPDYGTGLKWMRQIASALNAASQAGIVHRDIKPENIMITRTDDAKVTDFGLAQLSAVPEKRMNLTQAGTTLGTPLYMSPEQIQGNALDHRSDQYSFGVTCFHMFAGRPPFPGKNAVSVAVQHLKEEPPALSSLRADLPKQLCDTIHKMMSKNPGDRFQTQDELEDALARLERIPVNTRLGLSRSWQDQLSAWFPSPTILIPSLLAAMMASLAAASQLIEPARLPELKKPESIKQEPTVARQFAAAILNPRATASWKAVIDMAPDSVEAEFARLRLGLLYVAREDFVQAEQTFQSVIKMGEAPELRHMKVLGLTGKAYALSRQARLKELENSRAAAAELRNQSEELLDEVQTVYLNDSNRDIELESVFSHAPAELRDFFGPIRNRTGPNSVFQ